MVWVRIFDILEVTGCNGGVDRWSWVRILDFWVVNGGVYSECMVGLWVL
jgi:hypothetical protein